MCHCAPCFFGFSCQLTTNGFSLLLDSILGYDIHPNTPFKNQPTIILFSSILSILFMIIGCLNGIFSLITFKSKAVCQVGCGLYVLISSIISIFLIFLFGWKFWTLILSHMSVIQNRTFLLIQCQLADWIVRSCLHAGQWLHSCVSIERAVCVERGVRFSKNQSRKAAKWVSLMILIGSFVTNIHDPIYRDLIKEKNEETLEQRFWCIPKYSSSVRTYDAFILLFPFLSSFILNILSAIIILYKKSEQVLTIQGNRTFRSVLRTQIHENRHLLLAPVTLVLLAIPQLVISFVPTCMESYKNSWLFLCGYLISFIPPMLTFIIFVLPSKFYIIEFKTSMKNYRQNIRRYLHLG